MTTQPEGEYRIDELARLAGTTVRNVRAYQDRGLLPGPRRAGRVGYYSETHRARLQVIGELLGRGYTLANIAELLAGWEQGRELSDLLGLEAALIGPWRAGPASRMDRAELDGLLGERGAAELLERATAARLVTVDGDTVAVDNPQMLEGAAVLADAGVPLAAVVELGARIVDAVDDIAAGYVEVIERHVFSVLPEPLPDSDIPRLTALVQRLRPLAAQVVDAQLGAALERRIQSEMGARLGRLRHVDAAAEAS